MIAMKRRETPYWRSCKCRSWILPGSSKPCSMPRIKHVPFPGKQYLFKDDTVSSPGAPMAWRLRPIAGTVLWGKCVWQISRFKNCWFPSLHDWLHFVVFNVSRLKLWSWCSVCISILRANAFFNVFSAVLSVTVAKCGVSQQLQTMHLFTYVLS